MFLPEHVERWADGPGTQLAPSLRAKFKAFAANVAGATLIRAFTSLKDAEAIVARAKATTRRDSRPSFREWFSLELHPAGDAHLEDHAREIASWAPGIRTEVVEFARRAPGSVSPLADRWFPYANDDVPGQRHLGPASGGVRILPDGHCAPVADAVLCCPPSGGACVPMPMWAGTGATFGWRFPGGDGQGVRLADVEIWWDAAHTDFPPSDLIPAGATSVGDAADQQHGTAVVVTACGSAAGAGAVGCAPATEKVFLATEVPPGASDERRENLHAAILAAARALRPLDVLLIEAQTSKFLPVERWWTVQELISAVTDGGVIVVEAAGTWIPAAGETSPPPRNLDPMPWTRTDSGAILVSAVEPWTRSWMLQCPYGSRVDCHAWGRAVVSSDRMDAFGAPAVALDFNGSSAAAAIVAGLALQISGIAQKHGIAGAVAPKKLRALLRRADLGSPSCDSAARPIGPMPDLAKLLETRLKLPHLFLRGNGADDGRPNWFGGLGSSPDLNVTTQSDGSGGIVVTANNRGRADAPAAVVDLYLAKASSIAPPSAWQRIGRSAPFQVPARGQGQSAAFVLPQGTASGVAIAVLGSAGVAPAAIGAGGALRTIADVLWHARALGKVAWRSSLQVPRLLRFGKSTGSATIDLWIPAGTVAGTRFRLVGADLKGMSVALRLSAANATRLGQGLRPVLQVLHLTRVGFTAGHPALNGIPSTSADRRVTVTLMATLSTDLAKRRDPATVDLVQTYRGREIGRLRIVM